MKLLEPKRAEPKSQKAQGAKMPRGRAKGPNITTRTAGRGRLPKAVGGIAINQKDPNTDIPPPLLVHTI